MEKSTMRLVANARVLTLVLMLFATEQLTLASKAQQKTRPSIDTDVDGNIMINSAPNSTIYVNGIDFGDMLNRFNDYIASRQPHECSLQEFRDSGSTEVKFTRFPMPSEYQPRVSGSYHGYAMLEHGNALYLIGGATSSFSFLNDVWKSIDGVSWTLIQPNAAFGGLSDFSFCSNGKVMVVAGGTTCKYSGRSLRRGLQSSVWTSTNGIDWVRQAVRLPDNTAFTQQCAFTSEDTFIMTQGCYSSSSGCSAGCDYGSSLYEININTQSRRTISRKPSSATVVSRGIVGTAPHLIIVGGEPEGVWTETAELWESSDSGSSWRLINSVPWSINTFTRIAVFNDGTEIAYSQGKHLYLRGVEDTAEWTPLTLIDDDTASDFTSSFYPFRDKLIRVVDNHVEHLSFICPP